MSDSRNSVIPDLARLRDDQRIVPLRPYEVLGSGDRWSPVNRATAKEVLKGVWARKGFPTVSLRPPVAWDDICASDRSWHFLLHSWDFLGPVLAGHVGTGEDRYLRTALQSALDWVEQFPTVDTDSPFAWYDMAAGTRSYRLAYVLDAACRVDWVSDEEVGVLAASAVEHARVLAEDERFAAHSNHGLYFAAGQAALARRFPTLPLMADGLLQANARLHQLLTTQFSEEGVHREHSPDYHRMVLETFRGLMSSGLVESQEFAEESQRIQEALAWFILPNGTLAMFGDTPHRNMGRDERQMADEPTLRHVLTRGQAGRAPKERVRAFPRSGYVVFRDGWPRHDDDPTDWSYLAQIGAFHSRVHKHADDLSFVWFDRRQELLVDAGRFGYLGKTEMGSPLWSDGFWYADPNRVFVESTKAHNTVEIDGRNHPRAKTPPYGSALEHWGEQGGVFYSVALAPYGPGIRHRRILVFRPGEWLLVFDRVAFDDEGAHEVVQRFQVAPEIGLSVAGAGFLLTVPQSAQPLHLVSLDARAPLRPARGQKEPEMYGWISRDDREMVPTWTTGFLARGGTAVSVVSLFAFADQPPVPGGGSFQEDEEGWQAEARWSSAGVAFTTRISAGTGADLELEQRLTLG